MSRTRSAHSSVAIAPATIPSDSTARNNRGPATTATDHPRTATKDSPAQTQDPTTRQQAAFVAELIDASVDPADLVKVATDVAADRDQPDHVRDLISRRACRLAQHACPPTAAATPHAIRMYSVVLDDPGHHQQAADLWQHLITRYQTAGQHGLAQQARLAHATGLHRQGRCVETLDQISLAWQTATEAVDDHSPAAATVLRIYRLMLDACHSRINTARPAAPDPAPRLSALLGTTSLAGIREHRRVCAYRARTPSRADR